MKKLTAVFAALLTLVGLSGCGPSYEQQSAEGTSYLGELVTRIDGAKVDVATYLVTGPALATHYVRIHLISTSTEPKEVQRLLVEAYRAAFQTFTQMKGTNQNSFAVAVTDGAGMVHFGSEVGLSRDPTYPEVAEWLKTR